MAWTAPRLWVTGEVVTAALMNTHLRDNLNALSTHVHSGAAGDGAQNLGPLTMADFTTAAAPAAPGAGKGRFYTVTGDRPGFRAGAAGAAEQLATLAGTETLTNKTLTAPTIADFTNAQHDHSDADDGGAFALATAENAIGSNVAMTNANQFYDGPSVSLAAGTWLIVGQVLVVNATAITEFTVKLWDGTTVEASGAASMANSLQHVTIPVHGIVTLGSTTTMKLSVAADRASSTLEAAAPTNGAGNNASHIKAIRVGN